MRAWISVAMLLLAAGAGAAEHTVVIDRSFPAPPGKVVMIDAGPLDLSVRSAEIGEIRLTVELAATAFKQAQAVTWVERHTPTFEDSEGQLTLTAPDPGGIKLFKGVVVSRARIELVLPRGVRPDLSTSSGTMVVEGDLPEARPLRLRSASGDLQLIGWAPELEARSTSGNLSLHTTRAFERLLARTAGGRVQLVGGAHTVQCDSAGGDIDLAGLLGSATVSTTSGNITATFDRLPAEAEARFSSGSGKVRVTLPPGSQPGGELISSKGEIRSAYPGTAEENKPHLTLAGTAPTVVITTTSGRIELQ